MSQPTVVIAPDSFKGSLPARQVAEALAKGLTIDNTLIQIIVAPQADGGEGLLDAIAATTPGHWCTAHLYGIHEQPLGAPWFVTQDGTAVIESAMVLGLPLVGGQNAPPLEQRSSHALGILLKTALDQGFRDITIGLGGSACNDAGLGFLVALGGQAFDTDRQKIVPSMASLMTLDRLDLSGLDPRLAQARIRVLCDVNNPLLGEHGASRVYGPQKGLTAQDIDHVETAFDNLIQLTGGSDHAIRPGSGAAGGLGFALSLIGGRLTPGAEAVMAMTGLVDQARGADVVITGEGRSDRQTLAGKLPLTIATTVRPVPTLLVSGAVADEARDELNRHFSLIRTLVEQAGSVESALAEPAHWLHAIGRDLANLILSGRQ